MNLAAIDLRNLTLQVVDLCARADREIIQPLRKNHALAARSKDGSGRNFVTEADLRTEQFLVQELSKLLPSAGFIAEESFDGHIDHVLNWVIDPIDGTTNFMHGLPPSCISIALVEHEQPVLGVIFELFSKEVFYAWRGGGAWCNDQAISVSKVSTLQTALLCTGFPYDQENESLFKRWIALFSNLLTRTQGVRRLGAAAVDLAYVAVGRFDGFYEYNLNAWDVAAGALIIQEAGGQVTDFSGSGNYLFGQEMIASNGSIHAEMLDALRKSL